MNIEEMNANEPFSIRIISNNEFRKNPKVSEQLSLLGNQSSNPNILNRDVYNSDYGFTVNTDYSKYIESSDSSQHSYTFLIQREEDNELLENLVITLQEDGTYKSEIVSYETVNHGQIIIKSSPLEGFDTSQYLRRTDISYSCTTTVTYSLYISEDCSCQYVQIQSVESSCSIYHFGGGGIYGGGSSSGGDGNQGGGGSSDNPGSVLGETIWTNSGNTSSGNGNTNGGRGDLITTSPFTLNQINALTIQTKNSQIKDRIEQMEEDLDTATKEQGSEFRRKSNVVLGEDLYSEYQIPESQTTFSGTRFPNALANSEVRVHMHHNNSQTDVNGQEAVLEPTFSIEDVFGMAEFYKQVKDANSNTSNTIANNISSILVSRRGLYALRVTDADKVLEFNDFLSNNSDYRKALKRRFVREVFEKTAKQCNGGCDDNLADAFFELNFKNFFSKLDTGLGLFVSYEKDENGDYIWTFLTN